MTEAARAHGAQRCDSLIHDLTIDIGAFQEKRPVEPMFRPAFDDDAIENELAAQGRAQADTSSRRR